MKLLVLFLSAALSLMLSSVPTYAQDQNPRDADSFRVGVAVPSSWSFLWDDSRSELISSGYQQDQGDRSTPLVNIYNVVSGEKRSIDVLKEFPNARRVYIYGLAGGPEGSVLLAAKWNQRMACSRGTSFLCLTTIPRCSSI